VLDEDPSTPVEARTPCPTCGSTARAFKIHLETKIELHSQLGIKARHGGEGKPFQEGKYGDDLHRKTGKWNKLERTIDRCNDRYTERIEDGETGAVIRDVDEPLSQHRGHGSAKKPKA